MSSRSITDDGINGEMRVELQYLKLHGSILLVLRRAGVVFVVKVVGGVRMDHCRLLDGLIDLLKEHVNENGSQQRYQEGDATCQDQVEQGET